MLEFHNNFGIGPLFQEIAGSCARCAQRLNKLELTLNDEEILLCPWYTVHLNITANTS